MRTYPRAATSVQSRVPVVALQNSKNVLVRVCCFCLPWHRQRRQCGLAAHMQVEHRHIDVVEQLGVVLDRVARREEDDDLLLGVLAQEGEQQQEALVRLADDVALLERVVGRGRLVRVDVDVDRAGAERDAGEVSDLGGLRGREEHGLAVCEGQPSTMSDDRPEGKSRTILRISSSKPTSRIRSASSMMSVLRFEKTKPGVFCHLSTRVRRRGATADRGATAGPSIKRTWR